MNWVLHPGGDLPHLAPPNTHIFFSSCYATVSLDFGHCPILEFTTHSPRMVNNHYYEHTPDSTRCYRAYEMQICHFMKYLCYMHHESYMQHFQIMIIIFSTYNFHSLYISCQYIKQAYINMIFTQTAGYSFSGNTT